MDDASNKCKGDTIVAGVNSSQLLSHDCPKVIDISFYWNIFIHSGTLEEVWIAVDGVTDYMEHSGFTCVFYIEDKVKSVDGQMRGDALACEEVNQYVIKSRNISDKLKILVTNLKRC